jgi:excisionase family DNA binding protein
MEANTMLSSTEIQSLFSDPAWAEKFPPILTVDQAAELAVVPKQTIYAWSSQDRLKCCSVHVGKHVRILRDKFIDLLFNIGVNENV